MKTKNPYKGFYDTLINLYSKSWTGKVILLGEKRSWGSRDYNIEFKPKDAWKSGMTFR